MGVGLYQNSITFESPAGAALQNSPIQPKTVGPKTPMRAPNPSPTAVRYEARHLCASMLGHAPHPKAEQQPQSGDPMTAQAEPIAAPSPRWASRVEPAMQNEHVAGYDPPDSLQRPPQSYQRSAPAFHPHPRPRPARGRGDLFHALLRHSVGWMLLSP